MHVLCDFSHVLLELLYTFEPIWTNLLTQCTQLPVPVFCCFCISGFPAIKVLRKFGSDFRELLSVSPPLPFQDRGCLEKLLRHPVGRRNPSGRPSIAMDASHMCRE